MGINILKALFHMKAAVQKAFYKLLFGTHVRFGRKTTFRKGFSLYLDDGGSITIGDGCFFNHFCSLNALENISIGQNCIFGENVKIYDHNHKFSQRELLIKEQGFSSAPVTIGNDFWICSNVTILKGVHIGDHCVIGAGCLIVKDISANTVVKHIEQLQQESMEVR